VEKASSGGLLALVTVAALVIEWRWALRLVRRSRTEQLALQAGAANAEGTGSATVVPVSVGTRIGAVIQTVVGLLFASGGGTVILGLMLATAMGAVAEEHAMNVLVGGVVIGLFPLLGGLVLFVRGVQNLNGR
jgi:hypothetical protein